MNYPHVLRDVADNVFIEETPEVGRGSSRL